MQPSFNGWCQSICRLQRKRHCKPRSESKKAPSSLGNEEALSILVSNLIDNSIKYTERDGRLFDQFDTRIHRSELKIEDSGPGIPVEERERVFDRFYRRRDTAVTGNGLGLAIAKEIAVRHGASIVLESSEALGGLSARILFRTATAA